MYELTVITRFAAAHQLKMVSAKCENLHGHNWKVEVRITGDTLDPAGVLVDFGVIKKHVAEIMSRLDHHYLNELTYFQKDQPSSENIACFIAKELQGKLDDPALNVSRVTAWESDDAGATYILPSEAHP
jgi:6-pyruvoyltetrahydropterin/6-carboxytetrahydropterin synthase